MRGLAAAVALLLCLLSSGDADAACASTNECASKLNGYAILNGQGLDASKLNGYAILNGQGLDASKFNGYAVLNSGGVFASKMNGYAVLNSGGVFASKMNAYAVLCTPGSGGCPGSAAAGSLMLTGVGQ